ncbi:S-adenosyl-L-methionine-dependent methyltransferase [Chloropicon primus]|uniref:S-adenosyl-L-methionine-dependent methyltransferase n=2 Tax=Chloropicon primus TaxID=1764295 RepID=A0A5B8MEI0_9CHLO|nr:S-adenosyl-L-methionine-dependent methyltransferase [Chloropicon primus]UPQ96958.1 S-adenosyl-L-methionine-dependent methyltransferase [Chloropicon primus]|eukprot:QDZ17740.1 S-adenosyl-L-methionine-dependent methyltransferase [Chloropicon primus]
MAAWPPQILLRACDQVNAGTQDALSSSCSGAKMSRLAGKTMVLRRSWMPKPGVPRQMMRTRRAYAVAVDRDERAIIPEAQERDLPTPQTPAEFDSLNFECAPSVTFWRTWVRRSPVDDLQDFVEGGGSLASLDFNKVRSLSPFSAQEWGLNEEGAFTYWAYHLLRSGFFVAQGTAGILASNRTSSEETNSKLLANITTNSGLRLYVEALQMFRQDFANIKSGYYALPYDMQLSHRQWNPLFVMQRAFRFLREAPRTLKRRSDGVAEDVWLKSPLYPEYYLNTWHYQTDGWLSSESSGVYETSTETLFLGQQDAMQRTTLVPLAKHFEGEDLRGKRIMELACGTGRFATFLKDNYPSSHVTCLDLSPFYLQEARENMEHWGELQGGDQAELGVDFVQAPAEKIPFPDKSYDAITCIYLFHEVTQEVRKEIVTEMHRILKPGGIVVFTDSIQLGDRPELDANIDGFTAFNEPNYTDYVRTDLGALFKEAGFTCYIKEVASRSKVLSFVKNEDFLQ